MTVYSGLRVQGLGSLGSAGNNPNVRGVTWCHVCGPAARRTSGLARLGLYVIAGILSSLAIALPFHSSWGSNRRSAAVAGRTTTAAAPPFAGLLSFCHGPKFEAMGSWTSHNHREYARRHRYDVFQGDDNILPHMHFLVGGTCSLLFVVMSTVLVLLSDYDPPTWPWIECAFRLGFHCHTVASAVCCVYRYS